jgi:hypothetical protein
MYSRSGLPGTGGESMYVHISQVALMDFSGNHKDQGEPLAVFPALVAVTPTLSESRISRISRKIDAGMEYQQQLPRWQIRCSTFLK